ncbi:hypothetical protein METHPM2_1590011 [Pseudomonas sp. PM2]
MVFLSARFSSAVFAGFFFAAFFESIPLAMMHAPLTGDVALGIPPIAQQKALIIPSPG